MMTAADDRITELEGRVVELETHLQARVALAKLLISRALDRAGLGICRGMVWEPFPGMEDAAAAYAEDLIAGAEAEAWAATVGEPAPQDWL